MAVKPEIIKAKQKGGSAPVATPATAPSRTMSPADQAFNERDAVEFTRFGVDVPDAAAQLERAGLYTRNSGNEGSGSGNMLTLSTNVKKYEDLGGADKIIHSLSQRGMQIAKEKGIKTAAEFQNRADEIFREADARFLNGKDYDLMKKNFMIPNLGSAVGRIYEQRMKEYVPARNRYTYNASTGQLDPVGGEAAAPTASGEGATPAGSAPAAPRLRVVSPK